jgi:hypothetical protein
MTDKKLQKLSRKELLEVMLTQGKEIERLQEELRLANEKLESREITVKDSGSIAEAALKLNSIFENADAAAQQYLASIEKMSRETEEALLRVRERERELEAEGRQDNES